MSSEQYQVPTGSGSQAPGGSRNFDAEPPTAMHYLCGDCATRVRLEKGQPIRCGSCGARVLYKERTKRMVQFEAR
ncbi:putative metallothionein-i gene transcription activator protein [Rhypophila decipiens]|uniref:Metallothionein-i gene transcription activator protein n=1 Tax=Rhypophila decipiens TaxID=261697 RepID=A0AAN6Y965_9PEZI|nr:putative metallothionein-i gene transcription activator protein [Rhypophila decipiens]